MTKSKQFNQWLKELDDEINFTLGITLEELPEYNWWDHYNDGNKPITALNHFFSGESYTSESATDDVWGEVILSNM